jgi:hypothetical protein
MRITFMFIDPWFAALAWFWLRLGLAFGCFYQTGVTLRLCKIRLRGLGWISVVLGWCRNFGLRCVTFLTFKAFVAFAIALCLAFPIYALLLFTALVLLFAALVHFALRLAEQTQIMFGVLLEIFSRHTVIAERRIAGQLAVFVDDLLRRATHLALGAGTVEDTVDNAATAVVIIIAAIATVLGTRA